jgi:hypothetical protein
MKRKKRNGVPKAKQSEPKPVRVFVSYEKRVEPVFNVTVSRAK